MRFPVPRFISSRRQTARGVWSTWSSLPLLDLRFTIYDLRAVIRFFIFRISYIVFPLWLFAILLLSSQFHQAPLQAQGSARPAAARVKLLCDLARSVEWPKDNQVLAVIMVKFSEEEAREIRRVLADVSQVPWRELRVTNYVITPTEKHLGNLPECGIVAISAGGVPGNIVPRVLANVPKKAYLTVGESYEKFAGMVNLSQDGGLTVDRSKIKEAGLQFPSALVEEYKRNGVRVDIKDR